MTTAEPKEADSRRTEAQPFQADVAKLLHLMVHSVYSDKSVFLREAARVTETPVTIHNQRIEAAPPHPVDVITARACAPLDRLRWADARLICRGMMLRRLFAALALIGTASVEPPVADGEDDHIGKPKDGGGLKQIGRPGLAVHQPQDQRRNTEDESCGEHRENREAESVRRKEAKLATDAEIDASIQP